jgi:hypothetical protein
MRHDIFTTNKPVLSVVALLLPLALMAGQSAFELHDGGDGMTAAAHGIVFTAEPGWTYFPEVSTDLKRWQGHAPLTVEQAQQVEVAGIVPLPRGFARLGMMDVVVPDPAAVDFDGDGFSCADEALWGSGALDGSDFPNTPGPDPLSGRTLWLVERSGATGPWTRSTVSAAIEAAVDGDVVLVREGVYNEQAVIKNKRLTVAAWPGDRVVLDGDNTMDRGLVIEDVSGGSVIGLTIQRFRERGLVARDAKVTLRNLLIQDNAKGAVQLTGGVTRWENSIMRRNRGTYPAVEIVHGRHAFHHCSFVHNVSYSGAAAIHVGGIYAATYKRSGRADVYHALMWNDGGAHELAYSTKVRNASAHIHHSLVRDRDGDGAPDLLVNTSNAIGCGAWQGNALGASLPGSAAIELAGGTMEVPLDHLGQRRGHRHTPDAGAIESPGSLVELRGDSDGDGLDDVREYLYGSNALQEDSDGDGIPDAFEVGIGLNPGLSQFDLDVDGDGFPCDVERAWGSSHLHSVDHPQLRGPLFADGPVLYVADQGTDGTDPYTFSSIQECIDNATTGDIIRVQQGEYEETIEFTAAAAGVFVHMDPQAILSGDGNGTGMRITGVSGVRIFGGCIRGFATAIAIHESDVVVRGMEITGNAKALDIRKFNGGSPTFSDCLITDNRPEGPLIEVTGGNPRFNHMTIAGNHPRQGNSSGPAVFINIWKGFSSRSAHATITNSILWNLGFAQQAAEGETHKNYTARITLRGALVADFDGDGAADATVTSQHGVATDYPWLDAGLRPYAWSPARRHGLGVAGLEPYDRYGYPREPYAGEVGALAAHRLEGPARQQPELFWVTASEDAGITWALAVEDPSIVYAEWDLDGDGVFETNGLQAPLALLPQLERVVRYRGYPLNGAVVSGVKAIVDADADGLPDCWEWQVLGCLHADGSSPGSQGLSVEQCLAEDLLPAPVTSYLQIFNPVAMY